MAWVLVCAGGLWAQTLAPMARRYRDAPTAARRQALVEFADANPKSVDGALALLALGVTEVERGEHQAGLAHLKSAAGRLPQIADYIAFYSGLASAALNEPETAVEWFSKVGPGTALSGRAVMASARASLAAGAPGQAVAALAGQTAGVPQPEGDLLLATVYEEAGTPVSAAFFAQRVYYGYPASKEAAVAGEMLERLRQKLGDDFPPPLPDAMLGRAARWIAAGNDARAQREYEQLATQLGGVERELALVRAGAARYEAGANEAAYRYLEDLQLVSEEADAERLYYMVQCARRLERSEDMTALLGQLQSRHADSEWRLGALVWVGNFLLLRNNAEAYVPVFRACAEGFPDSSRADYCFWKVAWDAYIRRRGDAAPLLQEYLRRFPEGEKASAATYFLGRLAEASGDAAQAESYYRQIPVRFANSYYVALAEERLKAPTPPAAPKKLSFDPDAAARGTVARSRLLARAGLSALADGELRFAARSSGTPQVFALELARQSAERNTPDQGVRHIKGAFPEYLATPFEAAPPEFWQLAFPLPYRASLERYGKTHHLSVDLLAGLIRQESEFTRTAISPANARGLMQVLPVTGRQLAAKLKIRGFRTASLFNADLNIRLGAYYFKSILDQCEGSVEAALAAYNGGKTRVDDWKTWAEYREPAEFIETIPITETRNYVQAVLRNSWLYQRIYSRKGPSAAPAKGPKK